MKKVLLLLFFFHAQFFTAQVGINTTTPNAQLDIQSSSQIAPSNTDGILIPKMDVFPATNPTAAQQGMLVYLTTATTFSGNPKPIGFYYWNDSPADWIAVKGTDGGTLDQAYDFGGAGLGGTITADSGAVTINGTDGLVSTGTSGSGAIAPSGAGTRMVWNPRRGAFRAGNLFGVLSDSWDDINIGLYSMAFGGNTKASGMYATAFGQASTASGFNSTAFGVSTIASGGASIAFGNNTTASAINSTSFGQNSVASGLTSTAFGFSGTASGSFSTAFGHTTNASGQSSIAAGHNNVASSYSETVIGIGATIYTPTINGATQFRTANATDRLFVIGNAIDANNNNTVDLAERSDALVILKNGITRLPATTNAMITAADGKAVVTKEYLSANTSGTLDQAYDFGGAGNGRVITADTGAVLIDGTDGLVSTGTVGTGAVAPSGAGTRMVWNPRKAAFRAGNVTGSQWDDVNVGVNSIAMGAGAVASGLSSIALGSSSVALGMGSVAFGWFARANATQSTAFGLATIASNIYSTAFGYEAIASGRASISFGVTNEAESFGETVLGIGATSYTPSLNGANQFRAANATDRLLVVGNAIDNDNDDAVDNAERSNALVILKNGNTGIGASLPVEKLQVAGRTLLTNGFSADNAALLYQNNTDYMFLGPQSGSSANGAALALFGSTNVSGGNAGGVDFNVPNGQVRMNHTNGNFNFSANSTSGYNANFEINDVGLQIGHNSASRAVVFRTASTERMRLSAAGDFGIGTTTPAEKLHISGPAGLTAVRIGNTSAIGATSNVALDFFRNTGINTDWRIFNIGANLTIGNSSDDLATINDLYQFQATRFMPMNDGTQNLGQAANRWNTLFATNGTINTSDRREKKEIQPLQYGLNQLMQLKPVTFKWNNPKIDNSNKHLGFIAQDLQEVIPEVVVDSEWIEVEGQGKVWKKTPLLGVNYAEVIPVLVRSIQEQQTIIDSQKKEIEQQKKLLESVLQRLTKMEQR